ncbi:MAG TPA: hypothetical protein VE085_16285 [Burkholderiales bacterium]|nr:hypothetical protein [Burkholderiales bacterium]
MPKSGSTMATHDVQVQMDKDNSIRTFATDYRLRNGDRVQVLQDGKVGPCNSRNAVCSGRA